MLEPFINLIPKRRKPYVLGEQWCYSNGIINWAQRLRVNEINSIVRFLFHFDAITMLW